MPTDPISTLERILQAAHARAPLPFNDHRDMLRALADLRDQQNALNLAHDALRHSTPTMLHYSEPVMRHDAARIAVSKALGA